MDTTEAAPGLDLEKLEAIIARSEVGTHRLNVSTQDIRALFQMASALLAEARRAEEAELRHRQAWGTCEVQVKLIASANARIDELEAALECATRGGP